MNHAVLKPRPSPLHWVSSAPDELGSSCDRSNLKHCPVMLTIYTSGYGYSKRLCKDVVCWFVSKYLPRYKLDIEVLHRGMKREGFLGLCDIAGETIRPRSFIIELDTYLDKEIYTTVLIHELIHLMDFCTGDLKIKSSKRYFKGECIEDLEYFDQPHEIRAHYMESILYNQYMQHKNNSK